MKSSNSSTSGRQLSIKKKTSILNGAMQIFLEHGYAGTTMDRIAVASGVSKPTLYNHFQDKEALFNALMEKLVHEKNWITNIGELSELLAHPPSVVLRRIANDILASANDIEQITFIRLVMGESGRFQELGKAFERHMDKPPLDALVAYLSRCPELKIANPAAAARIFMGTLIYRLISHDLLHGEDIVPMDRDILIDSLIDAIVGT